jgi:predicted acyl esterase
MRNMRVVSGPLFVLLLIGMGLAGCLNGVDETPDPLEDPAAGLVDEDGLSIARVSGWVFETFIHDLDPTIRLHGEVFLPDRSTLLEGMELAETHPTVLVTSPYLGAGYQGEVPGSALFSYLVEELVPRGYAVAFIGSASTGGTGGCWDFMGPIDQEVAVAAVEAVTSQPWSDGKVGMIGVSYDAMTQIMAASNQAPGLVTIVPIAPLTHAYAGLYQGGIHYSGGWMLTTTLYYQISVTPPGTNEERLPGWAQSVALTPTCITQNTVFGNDPTGSYNEYFQDRDFRPKAKDVQASVFFMHGFLDANTKPDNPFPWYNDLEVPKKFWQGHWAHSTANATWAGRADMYPTLHRWFDHFLMDIPNGMDQELGVEVQDSLGRWRHEADWPPADAQTLRMYPSSDGALGDAPGSGTTSFGGPNSLVVEDGSVFRSERIDQPLHVSGIPQLEIEVASDRAGGQVIAEVHLVRENGDSRLVTRGGLNLHHPDGPQASPQPLVPLEPIQATVELYPTDFILEAGAHLELVLRTQDLSLWYNPDPHQATLTTVLGEHTVLLMPIIERDPESVLFTGCGRHLDGWADCHDDELKDIR